MGLLYRLLTAVERFATAIAVVLMFAIMMVVSADVFMRYVFNKPFGWAYDLISLYMMAGVFFLVLSHAYAAGAHVSVDILQQRFPERVYRVSEIVTTGASFVVFVVIAWVGFDRMLDAYRSSDVIAGAIPWPTWPSIALVPFGAGLIAFRLALHFASHVSALLTGRDLIPIARHGHEMQGSFE